MDKGVIENDLYKIDAKVLRILLMDKTTGRNIIWATDAYASHGEGYAFEDEIFPGSITGMFEGIVRPRVEKTRDEQLFRVKKKAEVFTPAWVCNKQNNLIDTAWFGRENVFNTETENGWITNPERIVFSEEKGKTWQDYVRANRLEISCGEAPYIACRYDAVTGERIPVKDRIGLLDRKLRVVSENVNSEPEWVEWASRAIKSVYAYDWQGDNVLLARENLLYTFFEYYEEKFVVPPILEYLLKIATIIAWNVWQMDGLKLVVPNSCKDVEIVKSDLLGEERTTVKCPGCEKNDIFLHNGIRCRIMDWGHLKRSIPFISLYEGGKGSGEI